MKSTETSSGDETQTECIHFNPGYTVKVLRDCTQFVLFNISC